MIVMLSCVGYADGSGVLRGMGKGLVGVIGLPVSGALGLVSSVSAGVASATGAEVDGHCRSSDLLSFVGTRGTASGCEQC